MLGANEVLMVACDTDVRPLLAAVRQGMGLDPDPLAARAASGSFERIAADRAGGQVARWDT